MSTNQDRRVNLRLMATDPTRIEGEALHQLQTTAGLPGMYGAVGLPDLHPGRGTPVGAAFLSKTMLYPHLIGNDAGCGMGLYQATLKRNKAKRDKWARKLRGLQRPWDGELGTWLAQHGLPHCDQDPALGTLGGGNHFAELQTVEKIYCVEAADRIGLSGDHLLLLVHSGSRGLGNALLRPHAGQHGAAVLPSGTAEAQRYLDKHDLALAWARANRELIAKRFLDQLNAGYRPLLDLCHNSVSAARVNEQSYWLHRKGASPSDRGPIVVPGSRGDLSYLVAPMGDQRHNLWSLPHGAGRKWNRSSARARVKARFNAAQLRQTKLGSVVICENRDLLFEEAPGAYKNIQTVIDDIVEAGLCRVIATLIPLITYKMRHKA